MELLGAGGQSKVYKLDEYWVFKHYKIDKKYPIDFKAIEVMCNEMNDLKRIILPRKIDYDVNGEKIVGTYSKFVKNEEFNLGKSYMFYALSMV